MTSIATILNSNSKHAEILNLAGDIGKEMNMPTYVVGGYIRDLLINKKTNDIDIMVEGDALKFANKFASKLSNDSFRPSGQWIIRLSTYISFIRPNRILLSLEAR